MKRKNAFIKPSTAKPKAKAKAKNEAKPKGKAKAEAVTHRGKRSKHGVWG